uniref:Protein FAM221A n=1 Tax=Chromera velia CCMP2878 TaxID=1169474 RepID=A0A0G4H8N1_9ALVE|eukprot:Cvel_860.t1-p1 / transcript=Cvel_860.t1 / gene=Cvel_860 / organism=Chromera_velia_CCMP2878 / gene_product=Protein FAM221A, putative / transcript_product=Protein FAM221A, putative / location=Cvel_scaffold27:8570-11929(+) / protein_length=232 / sequence_SO=supercontig / SO=protein_coding / is_pseudo=false
MAGLPPGMSKQEAAMHVDAYMEYRNLVGDTDGGAPLPEREYEELRRKAAKAKQNELFVFFRNSKGLDCRAAGPSSRCFCTHRYRDHAWFEVDTKRVKCRMAGCPCKCYQLIPVQGSQDIKCRQCRHSFEDHKADPKLMKACGKPNCRCSCFTAVWSCSCGETWEDHQTVFETEIPGQPYRIRARGALQGLFHRLRAVQYRGGSKEEGLLGEHLSEVLLGRLEGGGSRPGMLM